MPCTGPSHGHAGLIFEASGTSGRPAQALAVAVVMQTTGAMCPVLADTAGLTFRLLQRASADSGHMAPTLPLHAGSAPLQGVRYYRTHWM